MDRYGLHPLSCRFCAGHLPRHSALNDIVKCALSSAGLNAVLEPVGLDHRDGKQPDGMTEFPFSRGKCLILDCTCDDSFSPSALALTQPSLDQHFVQQNFARTLGMKGYVIDTFFKQLKLKPFVCLDEIQTPSFHDWVA